MQLPEKFKWIENIGVLPKLIAAALQYLGVKEITGGKSNPVIMDMAKGLGIDDIYTNDDMSWCGLFINHLLRITGKPPLDYKGDRYNILRAKRMLDWGEPVFKGDEQFGDILVFQRPGGGHVALLVAETPSTYIVLGGNQSNQVGFTEIAKDRMIGARRFYATHAPESAKKYFMGSDGAVSTNED